MARSQSRAQRQADKYDRSAIATVLHDANVYVAADADAQKISLVTPGHEVVIVERNGPWIKVFANTDINDDADEDDRNKPEFGEDANVTPASGWIRNKGIVGLATVNGDTILFGSAAGFEDEAAQPHAPKGAAASAKLLYKRVTEYFPNSKLAPRAAFRSADIRWQLDKLDMSTLPSTKEQEAYLRPQLYEGELKKVMKMYPGTEYAARAAYDLLDNKLCGDWQGLPKCPEMETGLYQKYAQQYPDSPRAAEALYNAVYRQGVVVTMYNVQEERKRSDDAAKRTQALADELQARYPDSDYAARAASIAFRVSQDIPIYGSDRD
jgi:outer membrane protein assembly factor BamD (BamD/ComL family)